MSNEKLREITDIMASLIGDASIPKNIRKAISDAKMRLDNNAEEVNVKVSAAIYIIDSISDDINMPAHARTQIWAIVSGLEGIKIK
ncbi:MAG: UPF0147 family protein [Candidatus Micrarchaeia archaeon]